MTDAVIYAWRAEQGDVWTGEWALDRADKWVPAEANKYILATPEAIAASPEARALIREAEARGMERAAERLDLAEHDAEERDWRSGANAFATLARVIRAEVAAIRKGETP